MKPSEQAAAALAIEALRFKYGPYSENEIHIETIAEDGGSFTYQLAGSTEVLTMKIGGPPKKAGK